MKRSREPEEPASASSPEHNGIDSPTPEMGGAPTPKIRELDGDGAGVGTVAASPLRCTLHPRVMTFSTYAEYDSHYNKQHVNRCRECKKNFPSDHILSLHIEEYHDSFVAAIRDKGEHTYSCFVEGCERKCRDPSKRRRHLIDKHTYPTNFFFDVTKHGIDGRYSLLCDRDTHRRTQSRSDKPVPGKPAAATAAASGAAAETPNPEAGNNEAHEAATEKDNAPTESARDVEMDVDSLASGMSSLRLVPRSISFGRGGRKGGFARSH